MADSEGIHDAVVDALSALGQPVENKRAFSRRIEDTLTEELADRGYDVSVERTPQSVCDLAVDDTVGVLVFTDFSHANTVELRSKSDRISAEFDALVVFGYDLPNRDLDRWRMGEFKYEAMGLDLDTVTFLRQRPGSNTVESTGWPSRIWRFAEVTVALLAIVIGLELAVLYQAFGGAAPSAELTLLVVVVLSAVLVFLYERSPV